MLQGYLTGLSVRASICSILPFLSDNNCCWHHCFSATKAHNRHRLIIRQHPEVKVWIRSCSVTTILSETILDIIQCVITSAVVKSQEDLFLFYVQTGNQDSSPLYVKIQRQLSNKGAHLQSRNRNFIVLWQCRSHAFNIPCKNSSKKPQQGFPSLLLLAVAFKLRILPLVRA